LNVDRITGHPSQNRGGLQFGLLVYSFAYWGTDRFMGCFSEPPETRWSIRRDPRNRGSHQTFMATIYTCPFAWAQYWLSNRSRSGDSSPSPWVTGQRLDQNRRAGGAPQAARMSSFVHPAQHLYSRGSDFLIARLSRSRSFPPFSHDGHCAHMFRLSLLRIVTCWVMSNAGRLNPTDGM
jgi:hypothetical protein